MAESSSVSITLTQEICSSTPSSPPAPPQIPATNGSSILVDKTLGSAANLVKLLPCGTVLAFQALSPSFSNHGTCHTTNEYLTGFLIGLCALSCCFFSFTDSFTGFNGKLYYGIATFIGFYIFNSNGDEGEERNVRLRELYKLRIRVIDFIHAFFSCLVFISLAFSDSDVQKCFFRAGGANVKELLVNLPLGIGCLSSLVFMIFPTSRKGIGYSDTAHPAR